MKILIRLLEYVKRHKFFAIVSLTGLIGETLLDMVYPWLVKWTIDNVIAHKDVHLLKIIVALAAGAVVVRFGFAIVHRISIANLVQKVIFDVRNNLYNCLQRLSFSFHDQTQTGQLMSRVTSDVESIQWFIRFGLLNSVYIIVMFISVTTIMVRMNWALTLLSLAILPVMAVIVVRLGQRVRPLYMSIRKQVGTMTNALQENILGVKVVKAYTREPYEIEKFDTITAGLVEKRMQVVRVSALSMNSLVFFISIGTAVILSYGGLQVMHHAMTIGELVAFNSYFLMIAFPMRMVGEIANISQQAVAAGYRIFEILDEERDIRDKKDAVVPKLKGQVDFLNVSFNYGETLPVLKDITLSIKPGETVALVGPTGSGKSTIANLLPRFYDISAGAILIDNHNIRDIQLKSLRQQVGLVFQNTFLFSASVAENIAFGKANANRDQIIACAKIAQVHDFIVTLPQGYDTVIGERGIDLSGGQKQRIAIARTLLMDPRILILDDSTSSVDVETEFSLQEALKSVMQGRTNIIIAHRFSSIMNADRIVVLENGQIVEEGTHEDLMKKEGMYKKIYSIQLLDK